MGIAVLRAVAVIAVVIGAACSLVLMFRAGNTPPLFLLILFIGWVASPYVGLVIADMLAKRRSIAIRATLNGVMLIVTLLSLAFYAKIIPMPPGSRPAALFLTVPFASWVVIVIAVAIGTLKSRRPEA